MKKLTFLLLAATTLTTASFAQDETDALRLSLLAPQGTARSIGFGSALGSIGGDFSSLSVNPAGIGIYRRSEFMISPTVMLNNVDARYGGQTWSDNGARFAVGNVGAVFTYAPKGRQYKSSQWKAVSVGLGLNRLADFSRNYTYTGDNYQNSASYVFESDANANLGNYSDQSRPAYLGYQAYLLDTTTFSNGQQGFVSVVDPTGGLRQSNTVQERGGISELTISLGGNYQEKLMLGATVGIPIVRYNRTKTFREEDLSGNTNNDFGYFNYTEELKTSGGGVNLKLGLIYRPVETFRLGLAVHTPTYFSLTDVSNNTLEANTESFGGTNSVSGTERTYDYNITTPWRGIVSAAVMLGKFGFVTADYEYVDYASIRYKFSALDRDYQQQINQTISKTYTQAGNVRAGLELRLDNFMLRGGFGYYGNPYKDAVYRDGQRYEASAGLGFRFANSFIDLGFTHRWYNNPEQPYVLPYNNVGAVPVADLRTVQNNVVLTTGWKF